MTRPLKGKRWIFAKHFEGFPKRTDMRLEEFDLPPLKDGEFLLEAEYLSVDPYMRPFSANLPKETVMIGQQVAKVIESRHPKYPVGTWTLPHCGWTSHYITDGKEKVLGVFDIDIMKMFKIPDGVPRSYALGTLGMPGITAYLGLLDKCKLKEGETVLVSGAAGAVGNVVGQIAKIKKCRVIGSAGSQAKIDYLKGLGFDEVFNYKDHKDFAALEQKMKEVSNGGFDVFYDNVGGKFAAAGVFNMKDFGRIVNCGSISSYNAAEQELIPSLFSKMNSSQLKMEGFIVYWYLDQWKATVKQLGQWVKEDKIKVREHVTEGFDNMFTAFAELFTGANTGKAVVKV